MKLCECVSTLTSNNSINNYEYVQFSTLAITCRGAFDQKRRMLVRRRCVDEKGDEEDKARSNALRTYSCAAEPAWWIREKVDGDEHERRVR